MSDDELISQAVEALERAGCQFWACTGPRLRTRPMVTCYRCATLAKLQHRLGTYTPGQPGSIQISEASRAAYLKTCTAAAR